MLEPVLQFAPLPIVLRIGAAVKRMLEPVLQFAPLPIMLRIGAAVKRMLEPVLQFAPLPIMLRIGAAVKRMLEPVLQFAPLQLLNICVSELFSALPAYRVQHLSGFAVLSSCFKLFRLGVFRISVLN